MLLATAILAYWALAALELMRGNRSMPSLRAYPEAPAGLPACRVSVIVAARQEAGTIEPALASLLAQDYPDFELIAVDDRSTDATGAILDRMAKSDSRLSVVHLTEVPHGWLGKNHALYQGTLRAAGQLLLFTDADVVMDRSTLRRAVACLQAERSDHLVLVPRIETPHVWLEGFVSSFIIGFGLWYRIWRARTADRRYHVGIGAFNLVRAQVYARAGTHRAIAMRPDDDMKLGKALKESGARQDIRFATDLIGVCWYPSLPALVGGLMKNAFAGIDYSWLKLAGALLVVLGLHVWPWAALTLVDGTAQVLYGLCILLQLLVAWDNARFHRFRPWIGLLDPLAACLMAYILARAAVVTTWQGGIRWRGTFYPLAGLKGDGK